VLEVRTHDDELAPEKIRYSTITSPAIIETSFRMTPFGAPETLAAMNNEMRKLARHAAGEYRHVSATDLQTAANALTHEFQEQESRDRRHAGWMVPLLFWFFLGLTLTCGALITPILRLPSDCVFSAFALVTADGGRFRGGDRPCAHCDLACGRDMRGASGTLQFSLHWTPGLVVALGIAALLLLTALFGASFGPATVCLTGFRAHFVVAR
jgi:hypothetical protein